MACHAPHERRAIAAAVGAVVLLALVAHHGALAHGFVWDDGVNLVGNTHLVQGPVRYAPVWLEPYEGLWIPVTYTVWAVLAAASREPPGPDGLATLDPLPFHAANLALHVLGSVLLLVLLLRWLPPARPRRVVAATLGALLFALHPIQVEAVHWATAMKDTLSTCLALGCLVLVPAAPKHFGWRLPAAWLVFALAVASKPSVVVLPAVWLLVELSRGGRPGRWGWAHLGVLATLAAAGALLTRVVQPAEAVAAAAPDLVRRVWIALDSLGFYVGRLLLPIDQSADYGRTPGWVLEQGWLSPAAWTGLAWLGLLVVLAARRRWRGACLALVGPVALSPVLGLIPFSHQTISTVADRYAYLAMIGVAYLLARLIAHPRAARAAPTAAVLLLVCAVLAWRAGAPWRDGRALWDHVLATNPRSLTAHYNLGTLLRDDPGASDQALLHLRRTREIQPDFVAAHVNEGLVLQRAGRVDEAVQIYRLGLTHDPDHPLLNANLAIALAGSDPAAAEDHVRASLTADPDQPSAWNTLGQLLQRRSDPGGAVDAWERASALLPDWVEPLVRRADVHLGQGQLAHADEALARALALAPDDPEALFSAGRRALVGGDLVAARGHFERALRSRPGWTVAHLELGRILRQGGDGPGALTHLRAAAAGEPASPPAATELAWTLATHPDDAVRDGAEAVRWAEAADALTGHGHPLVLTALAAAYAEAGRFEEAVATQRRVLAMAPPEQRPVQQSRLDLYLSGRPARDGP